MKVFNFLVSVFFVFCAIGCAKKGDLTSTVPENPGIFIKKVENMPQNFIRGVDISTVVAQEESGVVYKDATGNPQDIFKTLRDNGVNYIRVRVWNHPYDENGNGYGGGNNDIEKAVIIGERAAKYKMPLLVDFHCSDFWADPAKQQAPVAWQNMEIDEKCDALYTYIKDSLKKLRSKGVIVGMVQIGNETTKGFCGETNWIPMSKLMNAGAKAVREVSKDIKIVLHFANPEKQGEYARFAQILTHNKVDFDVFGTSWYPYWHGTKENLAEVLSQVAEATGKQVLLTEFSWAWTYENGDNAHNTISEGSAIDKPYSISIQGQVDCIHDAIETMASLGEKSLGVFWWEPAWIPVPGDTWEEQSKLWEKYGSGWASSYAAAYDPDDAGKYFGGSAWDNQGLFDFEGKPLPSLAAFGLASTGATTTVRPDTAEETEIRVRLEDPVKLPETVKVFNNDGSSSMISVTWNKTSEDGIPVEDLSKYGPNDYQVYGNAGGVKTLAKVIAVEQNYVDNASFDDKDVSMWNLEDLSGMKELYIETNKNNAKTGEKSLHFWSDSDIHFKVSQKLTGLKNGKYKLSVVLHGGDAGEQDIKLFANAGGAEYSVPTDVDGWRNFRTPVIRNVNVTDGTAVIGAEVTCEAGGWGSFDDFVFTPEKE